MSARVAGDAELVEALRARRGKGKEPVEREAMQDRRLTMKARGILGYLVSKPDKWRTNAQAIADDCDHDGRDKIATGLKELEEKGYLARKRRRGPDGRFVWCWIYSDDPDEVADVLAEMFPDGSGTKPDARRRGRARAKTLGGEPLVRPTTGKPGSGATDPQVGAMNGFSVDGSSVDGSTADGEPGDIEIQEREIPPSPPRSGGNEVPPHDAEPPETERCGAHRRWHCRDCGVGPRAEARAEKDRAAAAVVAATEAGRCCRMCDAEGNRLLSPGVVLTPKRRCDHDTPLREVLAEVRAKEDAAERARAAASARAAAAGGELTPPVSSSARDEAMEAVRRCRSSSRASSRVSWREPQVSAGSDPGSSGEGPDDVGGREHGVTVAG